MPTYHIEMMEGRTVEQKKKLVEEILSLIHISEPTRPY